MNSQEVNYGYNNRKGYFAEYGKGLDSFRIYSQNPEDHGHSLERAKRIARIQEIVSTVIFAVAAATLVTMMVVAVVHGAPLPMMSQNAAIITAVVASTLALGAIFSVLSYKKMQERLAQEQDADMNEVSHALQQAKEMYEQNDTDQQLAIQMHPLPADMDEDESSDEDGLPWNALKPVLPPGRRFEIEYGNDLEVTAASASGRPHIGFALNDDEEEVVFERPRSSGTITHHSVMRPGVNTVEPKHPSAVVLPRARSEARDAKKRVLPPTAVPPRVRPESEKASGEPTLPPTAVPPRVRPESVEAPREPVRPPSPPIPAIDRRPVLLLDDPDLLSTQLYRPQSNKYY